MYQPLWPLCFCLYSDPRPPAGSCWKGPGLFLRPGFPFCWPNSLVTFAWLCNQIVGITEEVPFPACQHRGCDCHPGSPPSARARPQRCAAWVVRCLSRNLLSLGPKRGDSSGWGFWFREGLDWFGCFKIDFLVQWCLWGKREYNFGVRLGWMGKLNIGLFYYYFLLCYCYHFCLDVKIRKMKKKVHIRFRCGLC